MNDGACVGKAPTVCNMYYHKDSFKRKKMCIIRFPMPTVQVVHSKQSKQLHATMVSRGSSSLRRPVSFLPYAWRYADMRHQVSLVRACIIYPCILLSLSWDVLDFGFCWYIIEAIYACSLQQLIKRKRTTVAARQRTW